MTVIVAARMKKGVVVAADSQISAGWQKGFGEASKLWSADPYIVGGAGCVRTHQLIKHYTTWPKYRADEVTDIEAFAVKEMVPAVMQSVTNQGVVHSVNGVTSLLCELVVAWADHFIVMSGNGAVVTDSLGRCAIGSGYAEALGHLGDKGPWTVEQVVEAARRATLSARGCSGPIDYVTTVDRTIVRGAQ